MDRSEVLVVAHRLRRLMPRNGDVLALTDWVLGSEGREAGVAVEEAPRVLGEDPEFVARLKEELAALKAGSEGCVVCAARKAKDRERLRGVMRRRREKERKR